MKHIMTFLIIAPYKYSYSYLLTYLLTSTVYNVKYIIIISLLRTKAAIQVIKTYKNVKLSKQTNIQ